MRVGRRKRIAFCKPRSPATYRPALEPLEERTLLSHGGTVNAATIIDYGPSANRVDIVFLGDGYTAGEIDSAYVNHINGALDHMFDDGEEPFPRYRNFFNVHRVDVISQHSGIDDPSEGVFRDTALDAAYDCSGIERAICVDSLKADGYLEHAPAPGEIKFVTVNSSQYGGSGGLYSVYAGGNAFAAEIALHELGHSFSGLADEYHTDGTTYTGPEPAEPNVTTSPTGERWSPWLGYDQPGIGVIGAYEGGYYNEFGIFRPSQDSKMRSLNRPFDAVGREKIIQDIYTYVDPLDDWLNNRSIVNSSVALWGQVIDPNVIHTEWSVDGTVVAGTVGQSFRPSDFGFGTGTHTVTLHAFDDTDWVRRGREALEQFVTWTVSETVATPGVSIVETGDSTRLREGGAADKYSLVLNSRPSGAVTIAVQVDNQVSATPASLRFTPFDWDVPQTVLVTAVADGVTEGSHLGRIRHQATSADPNYAGIAISTVTATIADRATQPPGQQVSFLDQDGDMGQVKLSGPGTLVVQQDDPDGDGRGAIAQILVQGTDPAKSSLAVVVKRAGTGDGLVDIGGIQGSGLKSIAAKTANLTGTGIQLNGFLGALTVRDILNGADVIATGTAAQKTRLAAHIIGDGTTIDVGSAITSLLAARFGDGAIIAPSVGTLQIKGDKSLGIAGDFRADVTVNGPLTTAKIAGIVVGSIIKVAGDIGSFQAAALLGSSVLAGFTPADPLDPMQGGTFDPDIKINTIRITGVAGVATPAFADSYLAAASFHRVSFQSVQTLNGGRKFGILADLALNSLTIAAPGFRFDKDQPTPQGIDDFQIRIV